MRGRGAEHRASISRLGGDRAMDHDGTHTSDRRSPRRRTWRWLAATAVGLFGLGLAVPAGAGIYASGSSHTGGVNVGLSDGSVRSVSSSTGSWMVYLLPYIEQDNVYHSEPATQEVNFAMGDGSVRSVQDSIDSATWQPLATRSGGEVIGDV